MNKRATIILSIALCASLLGGCGDHRRLSYANPEKLLTADYPINTNETLTYWIQNYPAISQYKDRSEFPYMEEWQKKTGIQCEWVLPTKGQEQQQFNILLASGDMPDIVEWRWGSFSGGPNKAIDDGYIVPLNGLMEYAPNFSKVLRENQLLDKMSKTDDGLYYYFPSMRQTDENGYKLVTVCGYMMRKDWLDQEGLPVPETIDEWHQALTAFKRRGVQAPLSMMATDVQYGLAGAYGIAMDYFQENGVVKYGPVQPQYKDFLAEMKKWHDQGLLDKNLATLDYTLVGEKISSGRAGAAFGWLGGQMGAWTTAARKTDPGFQLVGVPFPTLRKGEKSKFTPKEPVVLPTGAAVSADSNKKELAVKFLDYGYGAEGHLFMNFGMEGVSYTMKNGNPTYTDLILHNPDGFSIADAMTLYMRSNAPGPYVQDSRYIDQYYALPEQKQAQELWKDSEADKYALPPITPTAQESKEYSKLAGDIKQYTDEMYLKFIFGEAPLSQFEAYVTQIKSMGLERVLQIQQEALSRFEKR